MSQERTDGRRAARIAARNVGIDLEVTALFPGQGSQEPGMGRAFAAAFPSAARVFDEASDVIGVDMRKLCWTSGQGELARTENAQPALLTVSIAAWRAAQESGIQAVAAAGHSVGAIAALVATDRLPLGEAVCLARRRGQLMASAPGSGAMCAVRVTTSEQHADMVTQVNGLGLDIAAENSNRQVVVSGQTDRITEFARRLGARATILDVSHAFHSSLMAAVDLEWRFLVDKLRLTDSDIPAGLITTGEFTSSSAALLEDLSAALCAPVRWRQLMTAAGPERMVAFGPGKALLGFGRHLGLPTIDLIDTPTSMARVMSHRLDGQAK